MDRGGYRRIRVLSEGADGEVSLCRGPGDETVVLRVVAEAPANAAIAADAASSPHVAPLLDLFELPGDRFGLVYPWLSGGTLADLLLRRPELSVGEAVTVLVSVARGVAALHAAGVAGGRLRPADVHFDAAGTPVLVALSACAPLTAESADADGRAFLTLAAALLPVGPDLPAAVPIDWGRMEEALFAGAQPRPVELAAPPPTIEQLLPSRIAPPAAAPPPPPEGSRRWSSLRERGGRVLGALRSVRRRVWVPAVLSGGALLAALLLVPEGGPEAATAPAPPSPSATPVRIDVAAIRGDDPLAAAFALAAGRDACLAAGDPSCLDRIDQPGSPLLEADRFADGAQPPTLPASEEAPFVQRTGDTALVNVGGGTVLIVRVDEEWRLRDVFAAEPPSSG